VLSFSVAVFPFLCPFKLPEALCCHHHSTPLHISCRLQPHCALLYFHVPVICPFS
jgi:hypothetical protein